MNSSTGPRSRTSFWRMTTPCQALTTKSGKVPASLEGSTSPAVWASRMIDVTTAHQASKMPFSVSRICGCEDAISLLKLPSRQPRS